MTSREPAYDAIVIGGGPGGSCAATVLATAGRRVVVLEKEHFPRFHVGESLLPYNRAIFDELGLQPLLESAGFFVKRGAQFHLGNGTKGTAFQFRNGAFNRHTEAFQVERSKFDDLLLRHAARRGAEVREGFAVTRVASEADGRLMRIEGTDDSGTAHTFRAPFVVDASGRGNLTGNQEGLRVPNPKLRKLAVFAHFEGVRLDPGDAAGDTVIVRLENKWFWLIPLSATKVSVGLVLDRDEYAAAQAGPAEVFQRWVKASPPVAERLRGARVLTDYHVTSDFSYRNRTFWSPRVARVGDAAGFIDPIFSSGVYVAMHSGRLAAHAVLESLDRGSDGSGPFAAYARRLTAALGIYQEMVDQFYTTPFMELFLEPRNKWQLFSAVNAVLAGETDGGWRLRWRMRLFFLLVRIQARHPIVPRISFAPAGSAATS